MRTVMILSSSPAALQTSSPFVADRISITEVSSSELLSSPLCAGIRKPRVGGLTLKHVDVREPSVKVSHSMLLKCLASGEFEVGSPSSDGAASKSNGRANLGVGSPVVIVEAPPMVKTAEPMPMMRPNRGLIKAGDAGRIIDRRPKDVWAVRFAVGAYLVDGKYFEPLVEEELSLEENR